MESIFDWSVILSIVGVLVIVTNIVVQVLKKLTWDKLPHQHPGGAHRHGPHPGGLFRLL